MEKDRQKKIFLMKVGVTMITVLIIAAWSFNLKNVWLAENKFIPKDADNQDWQGLKANLADALNSAQERLVNLQEATKKQDQKDKSVFLGEVLAGAQKIASTTDSATSSAIIVPDKPTVKPGRRCPEYIDCMPTVGAPRSCQVPAGCEGITTIAY